MKAKKYTLADKIEIMAKAGMTVTIGMLKSIYEFVEPERENKLAYRIDIPVEMDSDDVICQCIDTVKDMGNSRKTRFNDYFKEALLVTNKKV